MVPNSVRDYLNRTNGLQQSPANVYEHSNNLLDGTRKEELTDFFNLSSKRVKLSNLGNDTLLLIEQDAVKCLIDWHALGETNQACKKVFNIWYAKWTNALDLTRAKDGYERQEQGKAGTTFPIDRGSNYGFGDQLYDPAYMDPQQPQDPFSKFLGGIGKGKRR